MSEFVWYARLAVWAGAVVLLAQAISGRGTSFMTLLGVILLTTGFAAFLGGLAVGGTASATAAVADETRNREPDEGPLREARARVANQEQARQPSERQGDSGAGSPAVSASASSANKAKESAMEARSRQEGVQQAPPGRCYPDIEDEA